MKIMGIVASGGLLYDWDEISEPYSWEDVQYIMREWTALWLRQKSLRNGECLNCEQFSLVFDGHRLE